MTAPPAIDAAALVSPSEPASPLTPLTPALRHAAALPARRFSIAFAPRVSWLMGVGLLPWLLALFWPSWIYALLAWEFTVVGAFVLDAVRLPPAGVLRVERTWDSALQLAVTTHLHWIVANATSRPLTVLLADPLAAALRESDQPISPHPLQLSPHGSASAGAAILPRDRGAALLGDVYLRFRSAWGLAERWARVPLSGTVWVYPDLSAAAVNAGLPLRARQMVAQRRARISGRGREFESLRPYREGDEWRDIFWPATARLGKPVIKLRQAERSQSVWLVMDCGRLMRTRAGALTQLDAAANAALALAAAAVQSGDRVGLLAYGRRTQAQLPPSAGPLALRAVLDALARLELEDAEADHLSAASSLLSTQNRRALILWLTEFPESGQLPAVVEAAAHLARRHLLLLAVPCSATLTAASAAVPATAPAMYQAAAALELAERRQETLRRLRSSGAQALELDPSAMAASLVEAYFEIKARGQL